MFGCDVVDHALRTDVSVVSLFVCGRWQRTVCDAPMGGGIRGQRTPASPQVPGSNANVTPLWLICLPKMPRNTMFAAVFDQIPICGCHSIRLHA